MIKLGNKEESLTEKRRDHRMKDTHRHTVGSLISFDNYRCLSQSGESKYM